MGGGYEPGPGGESAVRAARRRDRRDVCRGVRHFGADAGDRRRRGGGARRAVGVRAPGAVYARHHRYVVPIPAPPCGSARAAAVQYTLRGQAMEIILRADVQHLGKIGEVVKVKDGFARNYLLPNGLAYPATEANKKKIAYEGERLVKQQAAEKSAAETEATRLADVKLTFEVKVGEEQKLYGSVTSSDIQRKLAELGIQVGKRKIDLAEPIRELGQYNVGIKIHPDVRPEVRVTAVKE